VSFFRCLSISESQRASPRQTPVKTQWPPRWAENLAHDIDD
jgi:hypothetical protein